MDLRHLRYYAAVAKAGSLTVAARQLNISQPALSYHLRQLEEELGVMLLSRLPRGVAMTEAGQTLLTRTLALLDDFAALRRVLAPFRSTAARPVTIGMTPTPSRALAPALIDACRASGAFAITIREGLSDDLAQLLNLGELDCALCYDPTISDRRLTVTPLLKENLYAVAKPETFGLGRRQSISFAQLAKLPLVLDTTQQAGRRVIDGMARELGAGLDIVSADSVQVKKELIRRNGRCTIVPFGLFAEEVDTGTLEARRIVAPSISRTLALLLPRGREAELADLVAQVKTLVQRNIRDGRIHWRTVVDTRRPKAKSRR